MSTYSPILRTELIGAGQQPGAWGSTTNDTYQYIFESAIAGYQTVTVSPTANNQYLTYLNGSSATPPQNQSIYAMLKLNAGSLGANFSIFAPPVSKTYIIWNNTSFIATFYNSTIIGNTTPAGSGVPIPAGAKVFIWSDGSNFYGNDTVVGNLNIGGVLTLGTPLAASSGGTGLSSLGTGVATSLGQSVNGTGGIVLSTSPTFLGIPLAPTAAPGTNTTQLATTAFVQNVAGALGTMSSQNANAVAITGGTITGLSGLSTSAGASIGGTLVAVSPNSGSTGGIQVRQNAGGGNVYVQFTNNTGTAEYGDIGVTPAGVINLSPATAGAAQVSGNKILTTATKLGLGITGETWNYPGRGFNAQYTNPYSYPIAVSATASCSVTSTIQAYVNGSLVAWYQWQFNSCFSPDTQIRLWDGSVHTLLELEGQEVELRSLTEDMQIVKSKGKITLTHPNIEVMKVHFSDGSVVQCTKIHKFVSLISKYVNKLVYVQADNLVRGDLIYRLDAAPIMVIDIEFTGEVMDTYCPQMEEFHNFELANGMFTHNCGSYGGTFIIVPPGATYQLNSSQGVVNWTELY